MNRRQTMNRYIFEEIIQELKEAAEIFQYQFDPRDERRGDYNHEAAEEFEGITSIPAIQYFLKYGSPTQQTELRELISEYITAITAYQENYPYEGGYAPNQDISELQQLIESDEDTLSPR